jgi:hypothetical protein
MGQATATAPATSTAPALSCPDVEKIVASIPANLYPAADVRGEAFIAQGTKFLDWSDKNAKGKAIDISPLLASLRPRQGGTSETSYVYAANPKITIFVIIVNNKREAKMTVGQVSMIPGAGDKYQVTITIR